MQAGSGARSRLTSVVAAGALAAAALSVASATPANAAVMVSGSVIDSAGNYASGSIDVYTAAGAYVTSDSFDNGAYDIPLADGTYKLEFSSYEFASEWYRDKADEATADVVTVAGAAQTLAPWTVDRRPNVYGVVRTADGRPVRYAYVQAYDAATGNPLSSEQAQRDGSFRITTSGAPVKLSFSGNDPSTGDVLANEFYNDKATLAAADAVTPTAPGSAPTPAATPATSPTPTVATGSRACRRATTSSRSTTRSASTSVSTGTTSRSRRAARRRSPSPRDRP